MEGVPGEADFSFCDKHQTSASKDMLVKQCSLLSAPLICYEEHMSTATVGEEALKLVVRDSQARALLWGYACFKNISRYPKEQKALEKRSTLVEIHHHPNVSPLHLCHSYFLFEFSRVIDVESKPIVTRGKGGEEKTGRLGLIYIHYGGLQPMGSQRVGHNRTTFTFTSLKLVC